MSLKRNIFANSLSQFYVALVSIITVPLYVQYMGAEAYGLIGFFSVLQAWFSLLDMGLTPTISRETARFRGGVTDVLTYRRIVRALEGVFLFVSLAGGLAMLAASTYIAGDWLRVSQLPGSEVQTAVQLMAVIIATRWMCSLYRGCISGEEKLVWLSWFNSIIATARFIGVLPLLVFVGTTPTVFFTFQLFVSFIELLGLTSYAYRLYPTIPSGQHVPWDWRPLKPLLTFSLSIAFTSSVWVIVTQTDKLVLSKILPLAEYGNFTLAVLMASGVMVITAPVSGALLPRMAKMEAEGNHVGLIRLYRQATQFISVVAGAISATLAFYAEPILWAWTGDRQLASQAAPVLLLYALGNGVLAVAAFPYYLQYAKGDMRLHLIGNALFIVFLIPLIIWSASHYGAIGAGYVWLALNLLSFVAWLPLVHNKFEPGLNRKWYGRDVFPMMISAIAAGYIINIVPLNGNRWSQFGEIALAGIFVLFCTATASSEVRLRVHTWFIHRKANK